MLQLQIENCNQNNAEEIVNYLEESGAVSVTMLDQQDDPILEPELGSMPLWPCVVVSALYDADVYIDSIKQNLASQYSNLKFALEVLAAKDWEKVCLDNFKPRQIGEKLLICPSWLAAEDKSINTLILDPGLAFGTGSHETTFLCLEWLEQADLRAKTLLDFGCGSGILGLAALKLGAERVIAVDIDEQALIATKNNALANDIKQDKLDISTPDIETGKVDIILANILLKTLISLKKEFLERLKPKGKLIASGVLTSQTEELIEQFEPELQVEKMEFAAEWAMIVFSRVL